MADAVRREVEAFHEFFVRWLTGTAERNDEVFRREFLDRCDPDFVLVQPSGAAAHVRDFARGFESAHGSNPDFRIAIRDVTVRHERDGVVLATYVEWQRNAKSSTPPDNGRISSVLFRRESDRLRWLHVHETWLPADVMAAGPYDF